MNFPEPNMFSNWSKYMKLFITDLSFWLLQFFIGQMYKQNWIWYDSVIMWKGKERKVTSQGVLIFDVC